MKLTLGRNRRARAWLLCGLLICACFAATAWQYDRAVRQAQLNRNLLDAISSQQAAAVQRLLRAGANPNTRALPDTPPPPPWQTLAATIQRLWRHQQPAPRTYPPTALMVALTAQNAAGARHVDVEVVRTLLDSSATPDAFSIVPSTGDDSAWTPLRYAVCFDLPQVVRMLLDRKADARAPGLDGQTLLHLAAESNLVHFSSITALLLAHGADVNARNAAGETPLIVAVATGPHSGVIKVLLAHGADVAVRDNSQESAFFKLVRDCNHNDDQVNAPSVALLLGAGADVNDEDRFGSTVLQCSIGTKLFPRLLSRGAKIFTAKDPHGAETMAAACQTFDRGREIYGVFETLRAYGVNINSVDEDGETPLLAVAGRDVFESNSNVAGPQDDDYAGPPVIPNLMAYLLKRGATVDAKDKQGRTALMIAAQASDPKADLLLLANGANVNARDRYGRTALMWAVAKGQMNTAGVLLAHGADKSARDSKGRTALDRARTNHFDANSPYVSSQLGRDFVQLLTKQNP